VSQTFHLLTGEYPPQTGGVGDYTSMVAGGLVERGCVVHVWCPTARDFADGLLHVHQLPDTFGSASRAALERAFGAAPGCVVLEYVPNALGARGANVPFCFWLLRMRRRALDVRVMFHEPYFYFSWDRPSRNALAVVQRLMAALLMRASRVAYLSTAAWVDYLRPWGSSTMIESPIPATIAVAAAADRVARWRSLFSEGDADAAIAGHFGTFGDHLGRELAAVVPVVLRADPRVRFVFIGRGGEAFAAAFTVREPALGRRVRATGDLSRTEVSAALRACDLVVQPYPDGVTTRRTSVMAALANDVAVVTTEGSLTEPEWRESGAVRLAPASDAPALAALTVALLRDAGARTALAARGGRLYDARFALKHTLDTLLSVRAAA
jgi:glycosyltransferase involved in cell wall biosynthesis